MLEFQQKIIGGFRMVEQRTRKIVTVGILAALAWVVSQFSFPLLPWAPFLKIDFSDIPIILGMYVYGPMSGIAIAAVRSLLSYVMTGGEAGFPIGDTAAFVATLSYALPIYYVIRNKKPNMKQAILGGTTATLSLTAVLSVLNWLVIAPLYMTVMGFSVGPMRDYLTISVIPFNLLKGAFVAIIFFVAFFKLQPYLEKIRATEPGLSNQAFQIK